MWRYHPDLLARPVPRYTSYPTATAFHRGVGAAEMESALASVGKEEPLSLYLHIPFCRRICWYCACNTGTANRRQRLDSYIDALAAEIDLVAERLRGHGRVGRIAFGGGSPNAVDVVDFVRLVDRLVTRFDAANAELSVEVDPRDLTRQWIAAIGASGVSRVSLGVQTLAPHVQAALGRIQPIDTIRRGADELRATGVESINFDLMYGLPGQALADLEQTLDETVRIRPDRIALFGYAHVPALVPRQRRIDADALPGMRERFEQAAIGHDRLTAAGYQSVGFDHFALPDDALAVAARDGRLRRNFQGFTDDDCRVLIGLGASAISAFSDRMVQNEKNSGRYRMMLSAGRLSAERGVIRGEDDRERAKIIENLLCRGTADFGRLPQAEILRRLRRFQNKDLIAIYGTTVTLGPSAWPYARSIAAQFDSQIFDERRQFTHAV